MLQTPSQILESTLEAREQVGSTRVAEGCVLTHTRSAAKYKQQI